MNLPNSAGAIWTDSAPSEENRFCVSVDFSITDASWCSRLMMAGGVPAGARMPHQLFAS
jgi:hypothetical protein